MFKKKKAERVYRTRTKKHFTFFHAHGLFFFFFFFIGPTSSLEHFQAKWRVRHMWKPLAKYNGSKGQRGQVTQTPRVLKGTKGEGETKKEKDGGEVCEKWIELEAHHGILTKGTKDQLASFKGWYWGKRQNGGKHPKVEERTTGRMSISFKHSTVVTVTQYTIVKIILERSMWREPSEGDFVSYNCPHKNETKMERQYTEDNNRKVQSCVLAFGTNLQKRRWNS